MRADFTIVHTADVHIDGGRFGGLDPATGRRTAWESAYRCWMTAAHFAVDNKVDAFLLGGDAFLNAWPRAEAVEMIADGLRLVASAGIPVVAVRGNHELLGLPKGHRGPLDRFADIPGVHVANEPEVVKLSNGLAVACLPWPRRSEMHLVDDDDAGSDDRADVVNRLAEQVDHLGAPSVLLGHATAAEARLGSARRGSEGLLAAALWEPLVSSELLNQGPWAVALLGHIHRRQRIGEKVYYCGSIDRIDFSEEQDTKTFSVVQINGNEAKVRKVPTPARVFRTIRAEDGTVPGDVEPGTIVRLLVGDRGAEADARRTVEEAGGIVARVVVHAKQTSVATTTDDATEMAPLDALEQWVRAQVLPEELGQRVLSLGKAIIAGEVNYHRLQAVASGPSVRRV